MSSSLSVVQPKNPNYAAQVVELKSFVDLPGCDFVKSAIIFGNSVIISKDAQVGDIGLFFPVEVKLADGFLAANNLFRKPEWGNVDPEQSGFFEQHGRVKAVKFRGHKSEGFFIPISSLSYTGVNVLELTPGLVFDTLNGHEICRKYVPYRREGNPAPVQGRTAKLEDSIVDGQFRFHFDTENLRRNVFKIRPEDFIAISDKWHGTSVVIGKLLVKRELNWLERLLAKFGVAIQQTTYGLTYSSRRVIKAVNGVSKASQHYYSEDVWGQVAKEVEDKIPAGFTLYGEIVGYTADGKEIQKGYSYGCNPGQHRLLVYRVTMTNADGLVVELGTPQMLEFLAKYGIESLPQFYYGKAKDLYPAGDDVEFWQGDFLRYLESRYVNDGVCPHNGNKAPAEGIVLRIDRLSECENFKCKNFKFLAWESKELDAGTLDLETAQSEPELVA